MEEQPSSQNTEKEKNEGRGILRPPPAEEKVISALPNDTSADQPQHPFDERTEVSKSDHIGHWIAAVELLLIGLTGIFFFGEYWEIRNQTNIMSSQITTAVAEARFSDVNTSKQMKLIQDQVDAIKIQMRQDQRPWIHIMWNAQVSAVVNKPPSATLSVANMGKSPARNVLGIFRIEVIKNGKPIEFIKQLRPKTPVKKLAKQFSPASFFAAGLMFLDDPASTFEVTRTKKKSGDELEPFPLSDSEVQELTSGASFIAIHGIMTYIDVFDVDHWTKFCTWGSGAAGQHEFFAKGCANYNEVDSNR